MPRPGRPQELSYGGFTGLERRARVTGMRRVLTRIVVLALVSGGCARPPRQFELQRAGPGGGSDPAGDHHQTRRYPRVHAGDDDAVQGEGCAPARRPDRRRSGHRDTRRREDRRVSVEGGAHGPCAGDRAAARRCADGPCRAGRSRAGRAAHGRGRRDPRAVRVARPGAGRHVHIHALSAAGLLSAHGSTVCCRPARDPGRRAAARPGEPPVDQRGSGVRHAGSARRTRAPLGSGSAACGGS